jgi:MSHA biogenesis protein MshJ
VKKLLPWLGHLAARLDKRSPRERLLLTAALVAVGFVLIRTLFFQPLEVRRRDMQVRIGTLTTTLTELDRQADELLTRSRQDPDMDNRRRRTQLREEVTQLRKRLQALTIDLISPRDMAEVLRELLNRQSGLRLLSLENLPATELLELPEEQGDGHPKLYRHPVRLVFSGTFPEALRYLRDLEALPRKLFWEGLELEVEEYPRARIRVTVYTLSFRKGWIGV